MIISRHPIFDILGLGNKPSNINIIQTIMCRLFTAMLGMLNTWKVKYESEETCYILSLLVNRYNLKYRNISCLICYMRPGTSSFIYFSINCKCKF